MKRQAKKHPDNKSTNSVKFEKLDFKAEEKNENKEEVKDTKELKSHNIMNKSKTLIDSQVNQISVDNKQGLRTSTNFRNPGANTDNVTSKSPNMNTRKMSALDIRSNDDYQIPNEEVVKNQSKMPFKSKL